jgi:hypothetical protein
LKSFRFSLYKKCFLCEVNGNPGNAVMSDARRNSAHQYAARLNSFKNGANGDSRKLGVLDLLERAASVPGLNAVDLNYPDHVDGLELNVLKSRLAGLGLTLNGLAMRYYSSSSALSPTQTRRCGARRLIRPSAALTTCLTWADR